MTPTSQHTPVAMLNVVGLVVAAAGIMIPVRIGRRLPDAETVMGSSSQSHSGQIPLPYQRSRIRAGLTSEITIASPRAMRAPERRCRRCSRVVRSEHLAVVGPYARFDGEAGIRLLHRDCALRGPVRLTVG